MKKRPLLLVCCVFSLLCAPDWTRACVGDEECDDGNPCTVDTCVSSVCQHDSSTTEGLPCDDFDPCTMEESCVGGLCEGDPLDADGDTYTSDACDGDDCDDSDPDVHPGATEGPDGDPTCSDGADNECDGGIDLDDPGCVPCVDSDEDGYGEQASENCTHPQADCDDRNPAVNPGALEGPPATVTCADGKDNDCDGRMDKDDEFCIGSVTWLPAEEAEASEAGSGSRTKSKALNPLAMLLVPIGMILFMKRVHKGK